METFEVLTKYCRISNVCSADCMAAAEVHNIYCAFNGTSYKPRHYYTSVANINNTDRWT